MTRDLLIHHLVALDAQLRRMRRLSEHITDGVELKARLPQLIAKTSNELHRLMSEIGQGEGWQPGTTGPERR